LTFKGVLRVSGYPIAGVSAITGNCYGFCSLPCTWCLFRNLC